MTMLSVLTHLPLVIGGVFAVVCLLAPVARFGYAGRHHLKGV